MPCRSDYMEPHGKEIASRQVAQHLVYLMTAFNQPIPENIQKAADDVYGRPSELEPMVQMLCGFIGGMSETSKNLILWNGRIPEARKLAEWWDEHQKADEKRIAQERNDEYVVNCVVGYIKTELELAKKQNRPLNRENIRQYVKKYI